MKKELSISQIIDSVANVLTVRGWTRGTGWWTGQTIGPLCLEGALEWVLNLPHCMSHSPCNQPIRQHPAYKFLQDALGTSYPLHSWNDSHSGCYSQQYLIAFLRDTADKARDAEMIAKTESKKVSIKFNMIKVNNIKVNNMIKDIKTVWLWNEEMSDFELAIQNTTPTDEKELVDA